MSKLEKLINEIESLISKQAKINTAISTSSVGWHIEHCLLTINLIIEAVKASDPSVYKWSFNFNRTLILSIGKIPRGRAKAPTIVQPNIDFNTETLKKHLNKVKQKLEVLNTLNKNHHFPHPYFGALNLKPTIKFLEIHTQHHIKIMKDIIK